MTEATIALQKIERETNVSEAVWTAAILVAAVGEIWGEGFRSQNERLHTMEISV